MPKHYAVEMCKGVEVIFHAFITSEIDKSG
jgi:hypothetical protein